MVRIRTEPTHLARLRTTLLCMLRVVSSLFSGSVPRPPLGYSRPLGATDLCKLQDHRPAGAIADKIIHSFEERQKKAAEYNSKLANGEISPGLKGIWWSIRGQRQQREKEWREKTGKKKASLAMAANDSVFWFWWTAGILRLISDVALITSPLLVKVSSGLSPLSCASLHSCLRLSSNSPKNPILPTVLDKRPLRSRMVSVLPSVFSSFRLWHLSP